MVKTVIILNDFCFVNGGASRVAIDTATALAEDGLDVRFLGAVGPISPELEHPRIRVTCLQQSELIDAAKQPLVAVQGIWNSQAYFAAKELLAACDRTATVVHIHGWTKALSSAPIRAAIQSGYSTILTLHDFFSACPNGAFFNYQTSQCCELRAMSPECVITHCDKRSLVHKGYRVARGLAQISAGKFPRKVKNYISLSRVSEQLMRPYLPAESRFFPLHNTIDSPKAEPATPSKNVGVVAVGRLDPEKGVELLIEAARLAGVNVTFVGDGQMRSLAESESHCSVTGWRSPGEVTSILRESRALVFASLWYETFGLVVDEASAAGVPSIVASNSAAAERIVDGKDGWIFRSGDLNALVASLKRLRDDACVADVGRNSYESFWARAPSKEEHLRSVRSIYDAVLSGAAM